jgi:hypothetical protein
MAVPPLPDLILYRRAGCHLCDEAAVIVAAVLDERERAGLRIPTVVERDIDTDPAWHDAFFSTIPVLELGDRRLELVMSVAKTRRFLAEVLDGVAA